MTRIVIMIWWLALPFNKKIDNNAIINSFMIFHRKTLKKLIIQHIEGQSNYINNAQGSR
jgi:hypothetical protein